MRRQVQYQLRPFILLGRKLRRHLHATSPQAMGHKSKIRALFVWSNKEYFNLPLHCRMVDALLLYGLTKIVLDMLTHESIIVL